MYLMHTKLENFNYNLAYSDMPHGTDRPYPIRILAFFEMIRPYHVVIRISGNLWGENGKSGSV